MSLRETLASLFDKVHAEDMHAREEIASVATAMHPRIEQGSSAETIDRLTPQLIAGKSIKNSGEVRIKQQIS